MEKTIKISGKDVALKSTGSIPLRYKMQFNTDFFADLMKMEKAFDTKQKGSINFDAFDSEILYRMVWCMAKTANPEIPTMIDWIDSFEDGFPLMDIIADVQDLLISSVASSKRKN